VNCVIARVYPWRNSFVLILTSPSPSEGPLTQSEGHTL